MALGALSREEPGAAAPAERKSQNKAHRSAQLVRLLHSNQMRCSLIRSEHEQSQTPHEPRRARQVVRYSGSHNDS